MAQKVRDLANYPHKICKQIPFTLKQFGQKNLHLETTAESHLGWWIFDRYSLGTLSNYMIGGDDDTPKIPLLNGSNWQYWEMMMKAYLQLKGLWPWVNGTKTSHPLSTKEQQQLDSGKADESTANNSMRG